MLLVIVAVILVAVGVAYAINVLPSQDNKSPQVQTSEGTESDKSRIPETNSNSDKTTDEIPVSTKMSASIDELDQSSGAVTFRGSVSGSGADGECSISYTNPNDKPVSRVFKPVVSNGTASCGPVEVSEQEFSYLGDWTLTFRYYSNNLQAVTTKIISIR